MFKKSSSPGFTIAEAIISFVLIGVIFIASIGSVKEKHTMINYIIRLLTFYIRLQNPMNNDMMSEQNSTCVTATGVSMCSTDSSDSADAEKCYMPHCWRGDNYTPASRAKDERNYTGGTDNIGRDFPGILFYGKDSAVAMRFALQGKGRDREFCEKLTEKINLLPGTDCPSFITTGRTARIGINSDKGGVDFLQAFSAEDMDSIEPSFIALNGQRFYISVVTTANFNHNSEFSNFLHPTRESYRFVAVDLNGNSAPNSQFKSRFFDPDIVLFAIDAEGNVIPLGLPEFSQMYLSTSVYYPAENNSVKRSKIVDLWNAKKMAMGKFAASDYTTSSVPYNSPNSDAEPLSRSSRLYATATQCLGKNCDDKGADSNKLYADDLFINLILQFIFREKESTNIYCELDNSEANAGCSGTYYSEEVDPKCNSVRESSDVPQCAIEFENNPT